MTQPTTDSRTPPPPPRLLTVPQVAHILSVSTRTVGRLIKDRSLQVRKVGRCTRVVAASVDRFVRDGSGE